MVTFDYTNFLDSAVSTPSRDEPWQNCLRRNTGRTEMALTLAARPSGTVYIDRVDEAAMGSLIMFSQYMTAYAGEFYDIDAFDQPGVEYGRKLTFCLKDRPGFEEHRPEIEAEQRKLRRTVG